MKKPRMKRMPAILIAAVVLCISGGPVSGLCEETVYTVNEWNYVDGSMDVTHGIPENAVGYEKQMERFLSFLKKETSGGTVKECSV